MNIEKNTTISHYKILSGLGKGGMGEVYLAQDTKLDRKVAIKFLNEEFSKDADKLNRFVQEAKAASALNHPNILTVYEIGETDDTHYIATEFIEGKTLRGEMKNGSCSLEEKLKIAIQISEALSAAHTVGIIHRDIKPENIMVRTDGYVKILDFGLAKLIEKRFSDSNSEAETQNLIKTDPGMIMGTPRYLSPEQARGRDIDARSDIFSFGIVLFEMFTGSAPFEGESVMDTIASILNSEPVSFSEISPNVSNELEHICKNALRKDPDNRYQSVQELLTDLKNFRDGNVAKVASEEETLQIEKTAVREAEDSAPNIEKDTLLLTDFTNLTGDGVFDKTLKLALGISLAQSPSIDIFADTRTQNTMRLMGHSPDDAIDAEFGREICRREGLKVYITGTIASLGAVYMITLEAVNAKTQGIIGRQLEQADSKEKVLEALGKAATGIREKLGESLSSIEKFDVPLIKATTPSLEALKVFTLGVQQHISGKPLEALPYLRKSVEIDPEFAYAYGALAVMYQMLQQPKLAAENAEKAYHLRERTSELEKLRISYFYHSMVTGDMDKAIEELKLYKDTYPRDERPCINLCYLYSVIGQFEKALEAAEESVRLNPNHIVGQGNLIDTLIFLNRFDEARKLYEDIVRQGMDKETVVRSLLFKIAFVEEDEQTMSELINTTTKEKDEYVALNWQAEVSAFRGRIDKSNEFCGRSFKLAKTAGATEPAAQYLAEQSLRIAILNQPELSDEMKNDLDAQTHESLKLAKNQMIFSKAALTFAFVKSEPEARRLIDEMEYQYPKDFVVKQIWKPCVEAVINLQNGKAERAIEELASIERFEAAAEFFPQFIRGLSYLELDKRENAIKEFQKILDHRGEAPLSLLYPLAQLGKASASRNKIDYQRLFEMWQDADTDIPILVEAKKSFSNCKLDG